MADVDNGDILRIGALFLFNGVSIVANTYHVRVTAGGGLTYAQAADDISEYLEDIYDEVDELFSDEMASYAITLANVTQDTTYGTFNWTNPITGNEVNQWLPQGLCCFTWGRTLKPRVQTRKYWGVFTEISTLDGRWTPALVTACTNAHILHHTSFVGTNGLTILGVAYNRTLGTYTDITGVTNTNIPAYQRRRKVGVGV